MILLETY